MGNYTLDTIIDNEILIDTYNDEEVASARYSYMEDHMSFPFEENTDGTFYYRTFSGDTDEMELVWHRDREDRIVESIEETDWMIQMDGEIPMALNKTVFIPKETYHRVIKGTGDLNVKIKKL